MRLELPPLRERRGDIPLLINNFLRKYNVTKGGVASHLTEDALEILLNYDYPGNVRELENIIEHACVLCRGEMIERRHLPLYVQSSRGLDENETASRSDITTGRDQWERERIVRTLKEHGWQRQRAARDLGMDRTTLWRKMKKYDISP
jgi:transcriptional regulator with PAS, ATPase and Fis domain